MIQIINTKNHTTFAQAGPGWYKLVDELNQTVWYISSTGLMALFVSGDCNPVLCPLSEYRQDKRPIYKIEDPDINIIREK